MPNTHSKNPFARRHSNKLALRNYYFGGDTGTVVEYDDYDSLVPVVKQIKGKKGSHSRTASRNRGG